MCINSLSDYVQAGEALAAPEPLQVDKWRQQSEADQQSDMQQLEGLLLKAVGGVEGLQAQLAAQEGVLQGQAVGLQQVADWLERMHAGSGAINAHLQRMDAKVDSITEKLDMMIKFMKCGKGGVTQLTGPTPAQLIPRSSISVPDGALSGGSSGAFGTVVRAVRDGGAVAVKVYNIRGAGALDQKDAVREALMLNKACHHNVVRCFGIVHDPDSSSRDSLHGSLVMEWVAGGNLYEWLQENCEVGVGVRVALAAQVAAAMRHLHGLGLVHGDLKPHNILLQFIQGEERPEVLPSCLAHSCEK